MVGRSQISEMRYPVAVLGIDAAWTEKEPSGVALWEKRGERWHCLRVAPSYAAFCGGFSWEEPVLGGKADVPNLLATCSTLLGHDHLAVVAVDMPLATQPITGRRLAENQVSRQFGARKCSVHSPTLERPGKVGEQLYQSFVNEGFQLALDNTSLSHTLLEVYPHVALLKLMGAAERVPYKAGKSGSYWVKGLPIEERKRCLVKEWARILSRLRGEVEGILLPLPSEPELLTFKQLKRYEDAIDALVCAWMGIRYLEGNALPLGDNTAAIWIPEGT